MDRKLHRNYRSISEHHSHSLLLIPQLQHIVQLSDKHPDGLYNSSTNPISRLQIFSFSSHHSVVINSAKVSRAHRDLHHLTILTEGITALCLFWHTYLYPIPYVPSYTIITTTVINASDKIPQSCLVNRHAHRASWWHELHYFAPRRTALQTTWKWTYHDDFTANKSLAAYLLTMSFLQLHSCTVYASLF